MTTQINYEKLLNISTIWESNLYDFALKKIFDYCGSLTKNEKQSVGNTFCSLTKNEKHSKPGINLTFNEERLEFLGDGLLQSVVTELIFETFPNDAHGSLSSLRSRLVRNSTLAQIVKKMGLVESVLKYYKIDNNNNHNEFRPLTMKNAADTFEALIGASLIDRGYEETRAWIRQIYAKYNLIQLYLNEDNMLDILQMYTKSSLPKFNYTVDNQIVTISTVFQKKFYQSKNKLKQKAKQDVVGKIVRDLIAQKLIPENILALRGCGQ